MKEEQAFQHWQNTYWKFGSSTDEALARRAWTQALNANLMEGELTNLEVHPNRQKNYNYTGIFVRAKNEGKWESVDIAMLTKESLQIWLRSRGGRNEWAESTVLLLLGHKL